MRVRSALATIALLPLFVAPVAAAGFGRDPFNSLVVAPLGLNTALGSVCADGSGGMFVAWSDQRSGNLDVYVQRYTATGAVASGWPVSGLLVCGAAGSQTGPALLPDGAGGAFVAWTDGRGATLDVYATRVLGNGTLAGGWPVNGLLLSTVGTSVTRDDFAPTLASDGAGGAFVVWTLNFGAGDQDLYGARITAGGALTWSLGVYGPLGLQNTPKIIPDGAGGVFLGLQDNDNGAHTHTKVARVNGSGTTVWGPTTVGSGGPYDEVGYDIVADGSGGVYAITSENSFGSYTNLIAMHFLAGGASDPNWTFGARAPAFNPSFNQTAPEAISDGAGGFLVAWDDNRNGNIDLYMQRVGSLGLAWPGWPSAGLAVATQNNTQLPAGIVSDGAGGAILPMLDGRSGVNYFVYAARILGTGSIATGWQYGGNPVETGGLATAVASASDGNGGALIAWSDPRGTASFGYLGVYAQNIDRFGVLGDARPLITRIADVPNDQGGALSVQWTASMLDADPTRTVMQYTVWRRVPGGTAALAAARARLTPSHSALRTTIEGAAVVYWEYVATEPARMYPGYSAVVPTTSDSMTVGNPRTALMISAESSGGIEFWQSPPDSGYSVDNIPPYAPAPFAGTYGSGVSSMHWAPVLVSDLASYRLYRGVVASFVPGPGNFVASTTDTNYVDSPGQPYYYRLTAIDIHGNESASTLLLPSGTLAVGDALPTALAFEAPSPNPARTAMDLRYALPRAGDVRLVIYDVGGRRVRTLASGAAGAGTHEARWDLRDDDGRPSAAGLYLARLDAGGRTFTRRLIVMR